MPKLQMIDLSNNAIAKVSAGAFNINRHTAANLIINLSHNVIGSVEYVYYVRKLWRYVFP